MKWKCIRLIKTGEIFRVAGEIAYTAVDLGEAVYTSKSAWKRSGRKYG